ncbi:MAG TPA: secretion system protein E [Thermoplasmata archaeon]|nr:MAG TPA: secretion system protein E [Thermoplasmata archaeon]
METQDGRKKVPFRSIKTDDSEIEKKVDDILNAHTEVLERKKTENVLSDSLPLSEKKRPSLFYVNDKKKTEPVKKTRDESATKNERNLFFFQRRNQGKTENNEKENQKTQKNKIISKPVKEDIKEPKSTPPKIKKHIGFKKKKKENDAAKIKKSTTKKQTKTPETLPQFEESIAQIKSDEAIWLDQKIKASTTVQDVSKPEEKAATKVEVVSLTQETKSQPLPIKNEPVELKSEENTLTKEPEAATFEETSIPTEFSAQSVLDLPNQTPAQKEIKIDELTPDGQIRFLREANQLKTYTLERMGYSESAIEEIDFYPIQEPFAYVEIIREKESLDKRYVLLEMQLSKDEEYLLKFVKETLDGFIFKTADLESKGEDKYLSEKVDLIIDDYMLNIDPLTKKKILYYLEKESIGLGKLEVLMKDPNIEDISCDGSGVFIFLYHRRYGSLKSNIQFNEEEELTAFVVKLAQKCGKHISISEPMLDATMPDGSRIQMTLSTEVTTKGSTFTIRKFSEDPFSPPDLIEFHTMSSEMVAYMWLAVENGINALIAGGTAAGKTSTLNALCLFIPRESKIVSIEETREINLPHPNWIPGVVRSGFGDVVGNKVIGEIDLYDLMKAALRQRPEYILVGEIRGKEAYVLFQAMATGHTTYSTVHADSAQSLIHRLEGKPIEIPRIMLQTLDVVCIQVISRVKNKRARRCKQIIEIIDIDPTTKEILTNEVFRWDPIEDKFIYSGKSYILERIRAEKDISREGMIGEIKNRTMLLDWMNKNNIREFKKVATVVAQYADNPADVMKKIRNDP